MLPNERVDPQRSLEETLRDFDRRVFLLLQDERRRSPAPTPPTMPPTSKRPTMMYLALGALLVLPTVQSSAAGNPFFTNDLEGLIKVGGLVSVIIGIGWRWGNQFRDLQESIRELNSKVKAIDEKVTTINVGDLSRRLQRLEILCEGVDGTNGMRSMVNELSGLKYWLRPWAAVVQENIEELTPRRVDWPTEENFQRRKQ